jgi:carbon monoxide dehydrogenase subunit G
VELKGERVLPASRATAWALLNDSEVLKECVPGCESMTASGDNAYDVVMTAAIGPVRARFKGKLSVVDLEPPSRYRLLFEGQSPQAGFARGEARVELEELAARETRLIYSATAQIGGKLAQIGARLIDAAAAATAERFFQSFAAQLAARTTDGGAAAVATGARAARPGFFSWLKSFLRHLRAR